MVKKIDLKLTYDGHGINNASDPYCARVATFQSEMKSSGLGEKLIHRYTTYPYLLAYILCEEVYNDKNSAREEREAVFKAHGYTPNGLGHRSFLNALRKVAITKIHNT